MPSATQGPMAQRERRLAYWMLSPTLVIILAIVLFPLLANFWISFKPIELADLRAPSLIVNERLRGDLQQAGDEAKLEYRVRNSSQRQELLDARFQDLLPERLEISNSDSRCRVQGQLFSCELGALPAKHRERISVDLRARSDFVAADFEHPRSQPAQSSVRSDNVLTNFVFTLRNYRQIFSSDEFWGVLKVSIYYTLFGTLGALVLGLFAAQLMLKSFPGRGLVRGIFLFPYVAPVIAVAFTWVVLLDPFSGTLNAIFQQVGGLQQPINFFGARYITLQFFGIAIDFPLALSTVIAFEAWRYFPLSFLFILARMQSISREVYEAAEMDGATPMQQFRHISLPQIMGILAVLFLLRFIWTFNKFDDIFLLTGGAAGTRTLTVDVYEQAFALANLGAGAAVAVVVFIVLLSCSLLFFKFAPKDE